VRLPRRSALLAVVIAGIGIYFLITEDTGAGAFSLAIAFFLFAAVGLEIAEQRGHRATTIARVLSVVFFGGLATLLIVDSAQSLSSGDLTWAIIGFALLGSCVAGSAWLLLRRRRDRGGATSSR
jgi:hypothetical protein